MSSVVGIREHWEVISRYWAHAVHLTAPLTGLGTLAQQFEDSRMEPQVISFVYVGLQSTKGGSARGGISAAKSTVLSRTLV